MQKKLFLGADVAWYGTVGNIINLRTVTVTNEYKQKNFSSYVSETNDFSPKSKQDLLNIYYTVLNNGWDNFSFYCDKSYSTCISDMEELAKDKTKFSYINQLVHPLTHLKQLKQIIVQMEE